MTSRWIVFLVAVILLFVSADFALQQSSEKVESNNYLIDLYKNHYNNSTEKFFHRLDINLLVSQLNKKRVFKFYNQFTNNKTITQSIIQWSLYYNVPIHLSLALAFQETKFNPNAININYSDSGKISSYDKGLFQLNSRYFNLKNYFNIDNNTKHGIGYFADCYKKNPTVPLALIGYNMGQSIADNKKVPNMREEYVNKILDYEAMLDLKFNNIQWE